MIADFITNSGGKLTTKETSQIYYSDTNIVGNLLNYGYTLIQDGRIEDGFLCLDKALLKNKSFMPLICSYKSLGWSMLKVKDSVYYYINKAISLDSSNARFYYFRSIVYAEDSLFKQAVSDISKAIILQPNNKSLIVIRGQFKIALNDFNGAAIDMEEIPPSMKGNFMIYRNRALICLKLNGFEDCIKQCDISIKLNNNYGNIYGIRAAAKSQLGDYEGAFQDLKKAVMLGDEESVSLLKQYEQYYRQHKKV